MIAPADNKASIRERNAARMRRDRAAESDLWTQMQPIENPERRKEAEADVYKFLGTYFPSTFSLEWNDNRRALVDAILETAEYGGDQAIAAPRGEGKSTIAKCVTIYCLVKGVLRFPLICAANGPDAERILDDIKGKIANSSTLLADYPELYPCVELADAPNRASSQKVRGVPTRPKWSKQYVIFPTVLNAFCPRCSSKDTRQLKVNHVCDDCGKRFHAKPFPISGAIVATRGLNSPIRGVNYRDQRPDLVIIDDPETRESAESTLQISQRCDIIDKDIGGLAGQGRKLSRVMLCTLMNRKCVAYRYTDRELKPSWNGIRQKLVAKEPTHTELWDEYIVLRKQDQQDGDRYGRRAHRFYLRYRDDMDQGAVVCNKSRFVAEKCPDGSLQEVSTLQHYYNLVADLGQEAALTEYQNDPPEDENVLDALEPKQVKRRFSGYPQGVVPPDCKWVTAGIDIGKRALHWVVTAWQDTATGFVIDYGVDPVTRAGDTDQAIDEAIYRALHERRDTWGETPFREFESEQPRRLDFTLCDVKYRPSAVYQFCEEAGGQYFPAAGHDDGIRAMPKKSTKTQKVGDDWFFSRQDNGHWLLVMNSPAWKRWIQDRFRVQVNQPRTLTIFQPSRTARVQDCDHSLFADHVTAEREEIVEKEGKFPEIKWMPVRSANHWFDALYMSAVAASSQGMRRDGN